MATVDEAAGFLIFWILNGRADPYAKLTIGTQVYTTNPHSNGGKDPIWNGEHTFEISTEKELLLIVLRLERLQLRRELRQRRGLAVCGRPQHDNQPVVSAAEDV